MTLDAIKQRIEGAIAGSQAEIIDLGGGDHIRAIVTGKQIGRAHV